MDVDDSILDDLDELYDAPKTAETPIEPEKTTIEKLYELQLMWAEKSNEIKLKQQETEITLGVKVLEFINTARKHVREEQAEFAKMQAEMLRNAEITADDKKTNLEALIKQFKGG